METTVRIRLFRLIVFALVTFYFLSNFHPYFWVDQLGWRWRFLTNWAQVLTLIVAAIMLARSFGLIKSSGKVTWIDPLVSATVVLNLLVVVLYWKLHLEDPSLLRSGDIAILWWREYYIHLVGPLLQWIDAFVIFGCFRRPVVASTVFATIFLTYVLWMEMILRPFSRSPVGDITSGLPYPFLNDMTLNERFVFYGTTLLQSLVLVLICTLLAFALRRFAGLGRG